MKKTIFILTTIILLAGCATHKEDTATDKEISYFEKNTKCFSYTEQLRKDYETDNTAIENVFYSPKVDSCVYLYVTATDLQVHCELRDVFTDETILESNKFVSDFQDEIRELGYFE